MNGNLGSGFFVVIVVAVIVIAFFYRTAQLLATGGRRAELLSSTPVNGHLGCWFFFLAVVIIVVIGGRPHPTQGLSSPTLDGTNGSGRFVIVAVVIILGITIVVVVIIVLQFIVIAVIVLGRWSELLSSRGTQLLSSPALYRANGGDVLVVVIIAVVRGIAIVIIAVAVIVVVSWGRVPELFSHSLASRHAEALATPAHRPIVLLLLLRIDLVAIGGIVVRESALDVGHD
mmetsp:Transcript_1491/g.3110  ORF Transcript_1491/g.3110 Transcript_1491/m.3110 type:complete len:230 (+) Transcript_1491:2380-3069(+)